MRELGGELRPQTPGSGREEEAPGAGWEQKAQPYLCGAPTSEMRLPGARGGSGGSRWPSAGFRASGFQVGGLQQLIACVESHFPKEHNRDPNNLNRPYKVLVKPMRLCRLKCFGVCMRVCPHVSATSPGFLSLRDILSQTRYFRKFAHLVNE